MRGRFLITGASGMVGRELAHLLGHDHDVIALAHADLDVADFAAVRAAVATHRPTAFLSVGAWTDVDGCERDPDRAHRVNALGPRNAAIACAQAGIPVLQVSTDYVFPGVGKTTPYIEDDLVGPASHYGRSKLAGERFVREHAAGRFWIVRTQWVYGHHGKNFVDTMLNLARQGKDLKVVDDQIGCPTFARDVARGIVAILTRDAGFGTYHCSGNGQASWFEFAAEIFAVAGVHPNSLQPQPSSQLDRPAPRPAYSVLRNRMLELTIGDPMPRWQDGLREYLGERMRAPST